MLTARRWRRGSARLVREVADSGILDEDELGLLADVFLAAGAAVSWEVPDDWFAGPTIVIDHGDDVVDDDAPPDEGPTVARREVFPPVRRWAAGYRLTRRPEVWPALVRRARELDGRHGGAIVAGMLDACEVLPAPAQAVASSTLTTLRSDSRVIGYAPSGRRTYGRRARRPSVVVRQSSER